MQFRYQKINRYSLVILSAKHYIWCMLDSHNINQLQINFWLSYNDRKDNGRKRSGAEQIQCYGLEEVAEYHVPDSFCFVIYAWEKWSHSWHYCESY